MTIKEFKQALLRGQGRCIIEATKNPQKYYGTVMWACTRRVSYDPQCEGTHSAYIYELINCYEDTEPFFRTIVKKLSTAKEYQDWELLYFAELLSDFAMDGNEQARAELWKKYDILYVKLLRRKRHPNNVFYDLIAYEHLCLTLITDTESVIKIAEDIGRLYCEKQYLDDDDLGWIVDRLGERSYKGLIKKARKSKYIERFIKLQEGYEQYIKDLRASLHSVQPKEENAEESLAERYANAKTFTEKKEILAQVNDAEALDVQSLISDAKSSDEELRRAALNILEEIRHPQVREFALQLLDSNVEDALPMFIKNFQKGDEELLTRLVKSVPVDFDSRHNWHSIHMDVMFMSDDKQKAPIELLKFIYENNYCSECRNFVLDIMAKRRLLTDEILQECLYDSKYETRRFAEKHLKTK